MHCIKLLRRAKPAAMGGGWGGGGGGGGGGGHTCMHVNVHTMIV